MLRRTGEISLVLLCIEYYVVDSPRMTESPLKNMSEYT